MTKYIALLRAVNVGGVKVAMADLKALCEAAGYTEVQTYIASGNVVFASIATPAKIKAELEKRLQDYAGRPVGVVVRTGAEMAAVLKGNPFKKTEPNLTYAIFLDDPPPKDALDHATGRKDEEMQLGKREIYVYYPTGMGRSKLRIPEAKMGTARNMNTVAKLVEMV